MNRTFRLYLIGFVFLGDENRKGKFFPIKIFQLNFKLEFTLYFCLNICQENEHMHIRKINRYNEFFFSCYFTSAFKTKKQ
jgi:hypothetical protein